MYEIQSVQPKASIKKLAVQILLVDKVIINAVQIGSILGEVMADPNDHQEFPKFALLIQSPIPGIYLRV